MFRNSTAAGSEENRKASITRCRGPTERAKIWVMSGDLRSMSIETPSLRQAMKAAVPSSGSLSASGLDETFEPPGPRREGIVGFFGLWLGCSFAPNKDFRFLRGGFWGVIKVKPLSHGISDGLYGNDEAF